jgi:hypothetical protein
MVVVLRRRVEHKDAIDVRHKLVHALHVADARVERDVRVENASCHVSVRRRHAVRVVEEVHVDKRARNVVIDRTQKALQTLLFREPSVHIADILVVVRTTAAAAAAAGTACRR